jgi:hypothetical protein
MNPNPAFDSSIPVLTEVVLEPSPAEPSPAESAPAEPPPAEVMPPESAQEIPTLTEALPPVAAPVAAPDWDAIELRIVERILAQLQPQLDAVVHKALASAADQIHVGLRQTIEQMVAQQIAAAPTRPSPPPL